MRMFKWFGWGYEDETVPVERVKSVLKTVEGFLNVSEKDHSPPVEFNSISLPKPRVKPKIKISGKVLDDKYQRVIHSFGKSYKDLINIRYGNIRKPPDAVIYPQNDEDILKILEWCEKRKIGVIPFGGGSSVVGGVTSEVPSNYNGVVSLDMKSMSKILSVDKRTETANIQAGILGPALEDELGKYGFAIRHYPQSFQFSTLGGWIASRSAGHFSTLYGKIEDMVQAIKIVTPKGIIKTESVPSYASGPDIKRFFIGSEGIVGIITETVMRLHKIPDFKISSGIIFPSFEAGAEAARQIVQGGIFPPLLRLFDEYETMVSSALSGTSYPGGSLLILGFESSEDNRKKTEAEYERSLEIAKRCGGNLKDKEESFADDVFKSWKKEYFEQPYIRDVLLDFSVIIDTLETATVWSNIMDLYARVKDSMLSAISKVSENGRGGVLCRITHVYPDGASLYFSFFAKGRKGEEIDQWWEIKRAASDAIIENHGTISHHHGVGRDHKFWAKREHGQNVINLLKGLKKSLDPKGIMNPGALI